MKKVADVLASIGQDNKDKNKKMWAKVGVMFESPKGERVIRLHVMPFPKPEHDGYPAVWLKIHPTGESGTPALRDETEFTPRI